MSNQKRTREDILSAIIDLIHKKGFRATGLKELFAVSQSSAGSFYNYFGSKDELGHALIDYKWHKIRNEVILPAIASTEGALNQLEAVITAIEQQHLTEPNCAGCLLGNLIVDLAGTDPAFRAHLLQVFDEWQGIFADLLRQAKDELAPEVEPQILAEEILTTMEGVMLMSRLYDQVEQRHRLTRGFQMVRQLIKSAQKTTEVKSLAVAVSGS
jgi:TetR/AcrR family transcriptional repressor of nem operon